MPVAGSSKRDACKTEACGIQDCLAKNDYDMNKCKDKVDKLKECCRDNLKQSVHCGMVDSRTDTDSGESQAPDDQVTTFCLLCLGQENVCRHAPTMSVHMNSIVANCYKVACYCF